MDVVHFLKRRTPTQTVFLGSLLMSLVATMTNPVINRDGVLYVETARVFLEEGVAAAFRSFDWPFLSILIAGISELTGFGLEQTGYLLNAFFMAGACAFLVASTARRFPDTSWQCVLIVLALPGLNHYRDELLREYGCWFFTLGAFWLALRWSEKPRWGMGLLVQILICVASLFRPEAVAFFAALVLWQTFEAPRKQKLTRILMIGWLPILSAFLLAAMLAAGHFSPEGRLGTVAGLFNPAKKRALFDTKAHALAAALIPYAKDQAGTIVFFGSLAVIPLKFVKQIGFFIIPLFFCLHRDTIRRTFSRFPLFSWALLAHLFVLSAFVVDMQFLAGRYVAVLSLLSAPILALGLWHITQTYARWKPVILALLILTAASNAISLNPGQTHLILAGQWLARNVPENASVYLDNSRIAYYASWRQKCVDSADDWPRNAEAIRQGEFEFVVLEPPSESTNRKEWLDSYNLQLVKEFTSPRKGSIVIATSRQHLE